jgi:hypothetical protein
MIYKRVSEARFNVEQEMVVEVQNFKVVKDASQAKQTKQNKTSKFEV